MILLNKLVKVEASEAEAIDYLRADVKFGRFAAGDAVRVLVETEMTGLRLFIYEPKMLPQTRAKKGSVAIVERFDASDDTYLCLFADVNGLIKRQWLKAANLELIEKMPEGWAPSPVALEFIAANKAIQEQEQSARDPDDDDAKEDEDGGGDDGVRPTGEADRIKAIADRAEASARSRIAAEWRP